MTECRYCIVSMLLLGTVH